MFLHPIMCKFLQITFEHYQIPLTIVPMCPSFFPDCDELAAFIPSAERIDGDIEIGGSLANAE